MSKNIDSILEFGDFSKKKRVNSKRKGSNFERKIAKILNERFETKEFNRTPGSGAFATTHKDLPDHLRIQGTLSLLLLFHLLSNVKMDMMYSLMICLNEKAILSLSSHRLRMTPLTLTRIGW